MPEFDPELNPDADFDKYIGEFDTNLPLKLRAIYALLFPVILQPFLLSTCGKRRSQVLIRGTNVQRSVLSYR